MRHNDDRLVHIPGHGKQQLQHHHAGFGVQRAGRLVAQQDPGVFRQRPGNGNPLLFTAGQFGRKLMDVIRQADFPQHVMTAQGIFRDFLDQRYVFNHGQGGNQVVALEHKTHGFRPVIRQLVFRQGGNIPSVHGDGSLCRAVQSAQQVQQRAFACAAGTEHYDKLSFFKGKIHVVQRPLLVIAVAVNPRYILQFHNTHLCFSPPVCSLSSGPASVVCLILPSFVSYF